MFKSIIFGIIAILNGGSYTADYFPCCHNSGMVLIRDTTGRSVYELYLPMSDEEVGSLNFPIGGDTLTIRWTDEFIKFGVLSDPTNHHTAWARGLE